MKTTLALLAFVLLSGAILRSGGSMDGLSLALVLLTLGLLLVGVKIPPSSAPFDRIKIFRLLGGLTGGMLVWLAVRPESAFLSRNELHLPVVLAASLIGLVSLSYAWDRFPWPSVRMPLILATYFALGGWLIRQAPAPTIDVWHFQQRGCELLLQGENPYAAEYPNPYADTRFLSEAMVKEGKIQAFPYPPLSLLLVLPGYLVGDVRWSMLVAMVGAAAFLIATGRKLGLPTGHPVELVVVAFLCNPWGVVLVEAAWTEPLLVLAASMSAWALAGGRRGWLILSLTAMLALKQYGFLLLPAFALSRRLRWSEVILAGLLAALIALPFLLWNPTAFWRGMVEFHLHNPLREDSLSFLAAVSVTTGCQVPGWIGLVVAGMVTVWIWRTSDSALSSVAMGSAATILAFFVFNRAAHLNYYWLLLALLALGVIASVAEAADPSAKRR